MIGPLQSGSISELPQGQSFGRLGFGSVEIFLPIKIPEEQQLQQTQQLLLVPLESKPPPISVAGSQSASKNARGGRSFGGTASDWTV